MIFDVLQTGQEMFSSDFEIRRLGSLLGKTHLQGALGSPEGKWTGALYNNSFSLEYGGKRYEAQRKATRAYNVSCNGVEGEVFLTKTNTRKSFDYHRLQLGEKVYELYPIGFGSKGAEMPLFRNGEQIALIEKESLVRNELHNYHVLALDEEAALAATLFCCYMYVLACYEAGKKIKKSVQKTSTITLNKELKAKYDPAFKQLISE